MPRRFPCLALRASSVKTLRHRTCGIRKISRRLQHPLNCVFGDAVNCPGVPPCLALRASSVETLRHRTCVVRKISRGDLQHPLRCVFGDAVNCPGVPLVWPCVLPQWRPCVTGLVWFEKDREAACSTRCAYFGDDVVDCPGVSLVWSCVLPQWRPCTTGLVEFEKDREGYSVVSKHFYYYSLVLRKSKVGMTSTIHHSCFYHP
jgi:hypothetical protein